LPSYDRTNICFHLINKEEEFSKVSSIISISKPGYVEKLPFKPLPPKEVKKKKRSKRREETVSSPKHVAPIIVFDESKLDDILMPVTYISDHDWEKHTTFDIKNLFGTDESKLEDGALKPRRAFGMGRIGPPQVIENVELLEVDCVYV
jgi:hypothetical protein